MLSTFIVFRLVFGIVLAPKFRGSFKNKLHAFFRSFGSRRKQMHETSASSSHMGTSGSEEQLFEPLETSGIRRNKSSPSETSGSGEAVGRVSGPSESIPKSMRIFEPLGTAGVNQQPINLSSSHVVGPAETLGSEEQIFEPLETSGSRRKQNETAPSSSQISTPHPSETSGIRKRGPSESIRSRMRIFEALGTTCVNQQPINRPMGITRSSSRVVGPVETSGIRSHISSPLETVETSGSRRKQVHETSASSSQKSTPGSFRNKLHAFFRRFGSRRKHMPETARSSSHISDPSETARRNHMEALFRNHMGTFTPSETSGKPLNEAQSALQALHSYYLWKMEDSVTCNKALTYLDEIFSFVFESNSSSVHEYPPLIETLKSIKDGCETPRCASMARILSTCFVSKRN